MHKYLKQNFIILFFILFLLILLDLCIFLPWGHDSNFHIMRIGQEATLINDKGLFSIPFYIYPDVYNGYGYGSPLFYCDLFFYPFALLASLGIDTVLCYKIMVSCIACMAFGISYFCVYLWKKNKELSLLCAIIYTIQPYFLLDLFTRAAIGEALALCFEPLVIFGIYSIFSDKKNTYVQGILCLGIGMSLCLLSHLISSFLIVIALIVFCLISFKHFISNPKIILRIIVSAVICLGISVWFWAPMLEQLSSMNFQAFEHNDYFLNNVMNLYELLVPYKIRYQLSSNPDGLIWFIGGAILCPISIIILSIKHQLWKNNSAVSWLIGTIVVLTVIMVSKPICSVLYPLIGNIRLPWRLMIIVTICNVLLSIILLLKQNKKLTATILVVTFAVSLYTMSYQMVSSTFHSLLPSIFPPNNEVMQYSNSNGDDLYLSVQANRDYMKNRGLIVTSNHSDVDIQFENEKYSVSATVQNNSYSDLVLEFPRVYYPGYTASFNGEILPTSISENGLVSVSIPYLFSGKVTVEYTGTSIQKISKYFSVIFIIVLVCFSIYYYLSFAKKKGKEITA